MKYNLDSLPLCNTFTTLGETFFSRVQATPFSSTPKLLHFNNAAAILLDLQPQVANDPALVDIFTGKRALTNSDPIAMLYAGHQFGQFVPQLGDGRAIILGETINQLGQHWEIQLKGSGLTPYSRAGDGRAVLRSSIREYLCSEAIHALGIPSTRALCLIGSDDEVYREKIEFGAMLTRLAPTHIRFGSFEVFYYRGQFEALRCLADYVIKTHYPALDISGNPYATWLDAVIERTAKLVAQWQAVGFCHGVMNSDNMSILGLTLDYGPFGFMEAYEPGYICNHSDHNGRYAYDQQPAIAHFNLYCLAQAILPLLSEDADQAVATAGAALEKYQQRFTEHYAGLMRSKLGLTQPGAEDQNLIQALLDLMAQDRVDYTILFRRLCNFKSCQFKSDHPTQNAPVRDLFIQRDKFDQWASQYRLRLQNESSMDTTRAQRMTQVNPKYILRNYMAEIAIRKAEDDGDYSEIQRLHQLLQSPFAESPEFEHYAGFPPDWAGRLAVSCSS